MRWAQLSGRKYREINYQFKLLSRRIGAEIAPGLIGPLLPALGCRCTYTISSSLIPSSYPLSSSSAKKKLLRSSPTGAATGRSMPFELSCIADGAPGERPLVVARGLVPPGLLEPRPVEAVLRRMGPGSCHLRYARTHHHIRTRRARPPNVVQTPMTAIRRPLPALDDKAPRPPLLWLGDGTDSSGNVLTMRLASCPAIPTGTWYHGEFRCLMYDYVGSIYQCDRGDVSTELSTHTQCRDIRIWNEHQK